jgi:hypothetical protein
VSNSNPAPLLKGERRILLHRYARPHIDAACKTDKRTKELLELFEKFGIGERQEEEDSASDSSSKDSLPLSQFARQSNVVGNPALKNNQKQKRLQPGQKSAPTTDASKKAGKAVLKVNKEKQKQKSRRDHG